MHGFTCADGLLQTRIDYELLEELVAHIDGEYDEGAVLVFLPGRLMLYASASVFSPAHHGWRNDAHCWNEGKGADDPGMQCRFRPLLSISLQASWRVLSGASEPCAAGLSIVPSQFCDFKVRYSMATAMHFVQAWARSQQCWSA